MAVTEESKRYWELVEDIADELGSDGCTRATNFHKLCCLRHDIHYRTHKHIDGITPITKEEADKMFFSCIVSRSKLGYFSPMAWWRWLAVSKFNRKVW
jgi:hypothetical protein